MVSSMWQYFSVSQGNERFAKCKTCGAKFPRSGKKRRSFYMSSMISHLRCCKRKDDVWKEFQGAVCIQLLCLSRERLKLWSLLFMQAFESCRDGAGIYFSRWMNTFQDVQWAAARRTLGERGRKKGSLECSGALGPPTERGRVRLALGQILAATRVIVVDSGRQTCRFVMKRKAQHKHVANSLTMEKKGK